MATRKKAEPKPGTAAWEKRKRDRFEALARFEQDAMESLNAYVVDLQLGWLAERREGRGWEFDPPILSTDDERYFRPDWADIGPLVEEMTDDGHHGSWYRSARRAELVAFLEEYAGTAEADALGLRFAQWDPIFRDFKKASNTFGYEMGYDHRVDAQGRALKKRITR